jgi:Arc/MetJ-type ribon-helix-helix transcriptional regulator
MRTKARRISKADETTEFLEFWTVWKEIKNDNDGRHAARDEFFRHVEEYGADPQDIVDGARWYALKGGNRQFKQHAKTWMNRGDYEDGCEEWRAHVKKQEEQKQRIAAMEQAKRPDNVVQMTQPRASEAERAAHVERMRAKLRGNA